LATGKSGQLALASAADNLQRAEEMEAMEHESEVRSRT
jgi:hypothetical protein